jgi:hypothetical protein
VGITVDGNEYQLRAFAVRLQALCDALTDEAGTE